MRDILKRAPQGKMLRDTIISTLSFFTQKIENLLFVLVQISFEMIKE